MALMNWLWQIKICKLDLVWRWSWNLEIGNFWLLQPFFKKVTSAASTASDSKDIRYQWKIGFLMIHSTKRDQYWSFWCQVGSNHQDQDFFGWKRVFEAVKASEIAEADEVNEAAEVLRPEKSLLRTSVIQVLKFIFILMFWKNHFF